MGKFNASEPKHKGGKAFVKQSYDPTSHGGSSATATDDLRPGSAYTVDTRNLDKTEKQTAGRANTSNEIEEARAQKFLAAARASGRFKKTELHNEPGIKGKTPRTEANMQGTNIPTLGDKIGIIGSTNYAQKPGGSSGPFKGF
jgi:hypothetical protein